MGRLEYLLAATMLRLLGWLFDRLPVRASRVVLATARTRRLEGNLLYLRNAIGELRPDLDCVLLLEPYSYGLLGKLAYAARLVRGTYLLRTSRLFVVDNAYLPVHVAPHSERTTVVQVWHATGALKRFGLDVPEVLTAPERAFLHRHYDWLVSSGEASRGPWSTALRTPVERVLPLGTPRTDFFFDAGALERARASLVAAHPELSGRRLLLCAPTFRGRGRGKRPASGLDARALRRALPSTDILVLKSHPNLDPALVDVGGFDVVLDPDIPLNDVLAATDLLITDYSSSIFEFALLRRPILLLVGDLEEYEDEPGFYLDFRTEMIGTQVSDTAGAIRAIQAWDFDVTRYEAFIARHLGASDGRASQRFVERFLGPGDARTPI